MALNEQKIKNALKVIGNTAGQDILTTVGTNGTIWKVSDTLVGELLGIRDISGFPCFIVDSDGRAAVGNGSIHASSMFSVFSTTQGSVMAPRMTQTQRLAIASPISGLHVYQTDAPEGLYEYRSTGWTMIPVVGQINKTRKDITGTTYTLLASDFDKILYTTNATPVTITIPSGLAVNQEYEIIQYSTGQVSLVASGTTFRLQDYELASTYGQYSRIMISWLDTETYQLIGELAML